MKGIIVGNPTGKFMEKLKNTLVPFSCLNYGDVIKINAPFEENTPEYYNGYSVYDVRGNKVFDESGRFSKPRPVMVISVTDTELTYVPLTSSYDGHYDMFYQYKLTDNSMTPQYGDKPIITYVETGNVRVVPIKSSKTIRYYGEVTEFDKNNITKMLNKDAFTVTDGVDKHAYISETQAEVFDERLRNSGYETQSIPNGTKYSQDNREFTLYNSGVVYYHFNLPLETIIRRTDVRENTVIRHRVLKDDSLETNLQELSGSQITYE